MFEDLIEKIEILKMYSLPFLLEEENRIISTKCDNLLLIEKTLENIFFIEGYSSNFKRLFNYYKEINYDDAMYFLNVCKESYDADGTFNENKLIK